MINAVLVFNNAGQPRLTKFYTQLDTQTQQSLIGQIYDLVSQRPPSACNFLPLPPLLAQGAHSTANSADAPTQIIYRNYATLSFILISTSTESPLALIDLIQVFVEALDRLFEDVCELDLIFGYETMHAVLGEMVVGGIVIETNLDRVVRGVRLQEGIKPKKRSAEPAGLGLEPFADHGILSRTTGVPHRDCPFEHAASAAVVLKAPTNGQLPKICQSPSTTLDPATLNGDAKPSISDVQKFYQHSNLNGEIKM
ncbi:Sigma-adaptin 3A [Ascosphaera aggregata]|nr:Sigma-adaptin 3A [Ascosphaera aggregata]